MTAVTMTWRVRENHFPRLAAEVEPKAEALVAKVALDLEGLMAQAAPYRFGVLSNSIQAIKIAAYHWKVIVGAEYGLYQEYGTRYMSAQPFVRPSVSAVRPVFRAALRKVVSL